MNEDVDVGKYSSPIRQILGKFDSLQCICQPRAFNSGGCFRVPKYQGPDTSYKWSEITLTNGQKKNGKLVLFRPQKWSYGPLPKTGRGPPYMSPNNGGWHMLINTVFPSFEINMKPRKVLFNPAWQKKCGKWENAIVCGIQGTGGFAIPSLPVEECLDGRFGGSKYILFWGVWIV